MALSAEIRKQNSTAYTITPGKYLWRKMKLILINSLMKDPKYKHLKYYTFAKGIVAYRTILGQKVANSGILATASRR